MWKIWIVTLLEWPVSKSTYQKNFKWVFATTKKVKNRGKWQEKSGFVEKRREIYQQVKKIDKKSLKKKALTAPDNQGTMKVSGRHKINFT